MLKTYMLNAVSLVMEVTQRLQVYLSNIFVTFQSLPWTQVCEAKGDSVEEI